MIQINCKANDFLRIEDLTEFQGELKHREEADVEKIIKSIKKHGFCFPFFVWKHDGINHVFDGHGRLLALKYLKSKGEELPAFPVVYINAKNEAEAKELLLKLNSNYGKMTQESVLEFLDGLDIDFEDLCLPDTSISFELPEEEEKETEGDDEVPEVQEEAISKRGEMYELGNSILMCGDSTSEEDVARLMNGEIANCVLTDAPYGIDVVQNNSVGGGKICKVHKYEKIIGDETTDTAKKNYKLIKNFSENQILFGGNYFTDFLPVSKCWIVWDKENTGNFADVELAWTSFDKGAKIYKWLWNGMSRKGSRINGGVTRVHPTQKPAGMLAEILKDFTNENDLILDCFGGSGSTLIACSMTNRKCKMIELSPNYCDVIRRRYTKWAKENNKPLTSGCLED